MIFNKKYRSKAKDNLEAKVKQALDNNDSLTLSAVELSMLNIKAAEYWYDHFQENDSPKGEFVGGVRMGLT